jgi:hypothetical protein
MPDSRSWNRREYDVTPAGYFTVLKPQGWFSTVRLPGGYRYLLKGPATPTWLAKPAGVSADETKRAGSQEPAASLNILPPVERGRGLVRLTLIVLGAAAITYSLLRWISQP